MRKLSLMIGLLLLVTTTQAQILKPVKWSFVAVPVVGKVRMYRVNMTALIENGWHIYSQNTPNGGPEPTIISFNRTPIVLLTGKAKEIGQMKKKYEEAFGVDVWYYASKVTYVQIVKVKKTAPTFLSGKISYMTCNKEQCINEEVEFSLELK